VFFAMPGFEAACRKRRPADRRHRRNRDRGAEQLRIGLAVDLARRFDLAAASPAARPSIFSSSSSQSSVWMLKSSVRLALADVGDVALARGQRQIRNVSIVPNSISPRARARAGRRANRAGA
jgi:hypothetical protein